jgi:hypothetical protein
MNKNKNSSSFLYIMYTLKCIPDDFIVKEKDKNFYFYSFLDGILSEIKIVINNNK